MTRTFKRRALAVAVLGAISAIVVALPTGPYLDDPQETYVYDQTANAIGVVNTITCIVDALNPDELVNAGNYVALFDINRCDNNNRTSSAGATATGDGAAAPSYARAVVNSARASATAPMRMKAWLELNDRDGNQLISTNMSVNGAPGTSNPYGDFRFDYKMQNVDAGGTLTDAGGGFLAAASGGLLFAESEISHSKRLALVRNGDSAGAGQFEESGGGGGGPTSFAFAYNASHFLRRSSTAGVTTDSCFDRALSAADQSVWRYALYTDSGAAVSRSSGFSINYTPPGSTQTHQGWAGYFGVNLPPEALTTFATGSTVVAQTGAAGSAGETLTVAKAPGRLMRFSPRSVTLASFVRSPFTVRPSDGLSAATVTAINSAMTPAGTFDGTTIRNAELRMGWDPAAADGAGGMGTFVVAEIVRCSASGCFPQALTSSVALSRPADLSLYSARGWSGYAQDLNGPMVMVGDTVSAPSSTKTLSFHESQVVNPGSSPVALHCVANCPTPATMTAFGTQIASAGTLNPFGATNNAFSPQSTTVSYVFDTTGNLTVSGTAVTLPAAATAAALSPTSFNWGVRTGRMVENLADLSCGSGVYCDFAAGAGIYYVWETGPNAFNQFIGLRRGGAGGSFVSFDPPLRLTYAVPNRAPFGTYAGRTVQLQYNGYGSLHGIPGRCVNPATNAVVECGSGTRYVPAFAIPFDPAPTPASENAVRDQAGTVYYVKWLNREIRFRQVAMGSCTGLTAQLTGLPALPALSEILNPTDPTSAVFIGAKPVLASAPRVVDGVTR